MKRFCPALFLAHEAVPLACPRPTAAAKYCSQTVTGPVVFPIQKVASTLISDAGDKIVTPTYSTSSSLSADAEPCYPLAGQDISSGCIKVTVDKGVASFAPFGADDLSALTPVLPKAVPRMGDRCTVFEQAGSTTRQTSDCVMEDANEP